MRLDLAVIEILLLGYGLFYGSFVATSAIFYGQEFAVPLAIGLPIVMLCGWSLVRKPFRTIVVVGVLSWIARPVISQWAGSEPQGLAARAAVVAILLGMPLPLVTQWARARRKRHALEDRSTALASFRSRADGDVAEWGAPGSLPIRQRQLKVYITSGAAYRRLEQFLEAGDLSQFDNELARLESDLKEFAGQAGRAGGFEAGPGQESTDPYTVLMCSPDSSFEDVKQAYKLYSRFYHPDAVKSRGGDEEDAHRRMKQGNLAFDQIKRQRRMQ